MGLFHSQNSTRGGFRRATFGSLLILGGATVGALMAMPKLHQAMTLTHAPVSLTCVELLRGGVPEHSPIVVLQDAQVHPPGELTIGLDSQPQPPMLAKVSGALADPRASVVLDRLVRGDVLPQGVVKRDGPQPLRLSHGRQTADVAMREIEETGKLTVHVSEDPAAKLICRAAAYLQLPVPDALQRAAEIPTYLLQPTSQIGTQQEATVWAIASGAAVAIGFILCSSASLGWWALFSPIGAVLGLPGIFLRGGRAGILTQVVSLFVGGGFVAGGIHVMTTMGKLGQPGGMIALHAGGFLAVSFGIAAILGTLLNLRAGRTDCGDRDALADIASSVQRGGAKSKRSGKTQGGQDNDPVEVKPIALQSIISQSNYTRRYLDPRLNVSTNTQTEAVVHEQTDSLERLKFDTPLIIEIARGEGTIEATVQIGCRNLVLAMTDRLDGDLRLRMVSFLEDGHVVVSGNGQDLRLCENVSGDAASLRTFAVSKAAKMVTKHLEAAAEIAELRQTQLTILDACEWRDLVHYSERCMADTLHHAEIEKWDICDAQYGRFGFPARRVRSLSMA